MENNGFLWIRYLINCDERTVPDGCGTEYSQAVVFLRQKAAR